MPTTKRTGHSPPLLLGLLRTSSGLFVSAKGTEGARRRPRGPVGPKRTAKGSSSSICALTDALLERGELTESEAREIVATALPAVNPWRSPAQHDAVSTAPTPSEPYHSTGSYSTQTDTGPARARAPAREETPQFRPRTTTRGPGT